jgi:hypothetical protein
MGDFPEEFEVLIPALPAVELVLPVAADPRLPELHPAAAATKTPAESTTHHFRPGLCPASK